MAEGSEKSLSAAHLALWVKEVAPGARLRAWFGHKRERFAEFRRRYELELVSDPVLGELRTLGRGKLVALVYAARDRKVNHAAVLQSVLRTRHSPGASKSKPSNPRKR